MLAALIVVGLIGVAIGDVDNGAVRPEAVRRHQGVRRRRSSFFLLLKGFSSGAVALTGVEAISNGVPSVPAPRAEERGRHHGVDGRGARHPVLRRVAPGARELQPYPSHDRTVIAQLGLAVFGNGPVFLLLQFATAAILTLAANTAYNGFPGLSSIVAKDGYLPRQLANRGDRLVFSNGVIFLADGGGGARSSRSAASRTR